MKGFIVAILHGGYCCGITHIQNFPAYPSTNCESRTRLEGQALDGYIKGYPQSIRHINDTRPAETAEQRFRDIVALIPNTNYVLGQTYACRPSGIIEVVLTSYNNQGCAMNWLPLLTELGFKEVNQCLNSNSGKTLHVFHKNTGA